jgi:hypothetical protein
MELVAEMGARCHAVVLAQASDGELAQRLREGGVQPRVYQFETLPESGELERLAAELRRAEPVT